MQRGLYKATFESKVGDTIENFNPQTLEMLAKNIMVKELYSTPGHDPQEEMEDRQISREEIEEALERHNAVYHQGQAPGEPINGNKGQVRIKYGNFELEIKKSVHDFVRNFKKSGRIEKDTILKSLKTWRRNHNQKANSDIAAASDLLENWDQHKESFFQTIHAVQYIKGK